MRIAVTGGTGSVGPAIVRALRDRGHEVWVISRRARTIPPDSGLRFGDVTRPATLAAALSGAEAVIHAAAAVGAATDPLDHGRVTVAGTRHVVAAATHARVRRFVHLSSLAIHAPAPILREDSPRWSASRHPYARAKLEAEDLVLAAARACAIEAVTLRPGLVLGPGDRHASPRIVWLLRRRLAVVLGDGTNRVPCLTMDDLAATVVAAVESRTATGPYLLAGTAAVTQAELWRLHARAAGLEGPRFAVPARLASGLAAVLVSAARVIGATPPVTPFDVLAMTADVLVDTTRAARDLGWLGLGSLERAVAGALASWAGSAAQASDACGATQAGEATCES